MFQGTGDAIGFTFTACMQCRLGLVPMRFCVSSSVMAFQIPKKSDPLPTGTMMFSGISFPKSLNISRSLIKNSEFIDKIHYGLTLATASRALDYSVIVFF